ncbi:MAG: GTPase ObgE [Bacteroidetes bacterium]|nr:GTPase ObgE [Bacteroidota bacterium]
MADSNFIDHVKILFRSGKGGAGSVHFRHEKFVPRGGPDGGDGGRGGDIILRGNNQLWTLLHLKYKKHIFADDGENGGGNQRSGASAEDIIVEVPPGTIVKNSDTGETEMEITGNTEEKIILHGGRGGLGNVNFKSSTNQAPRYAQPGEPGKEEWKILELKLLADVGLVGFPNAGKSTLLSVLSSAKPAVADYPFTTLTPTVGIVKYHGRQSFVMADIPGIIEGAHAGKGLGLRFLRHIERNSILLFLIPCDSKDIFKEYKILLSELKHYSDELALKKRVVGISKCDLLDDELLLEIKNEVNRQFAKSEEIPLIFFSSFKKTGLNHLKEKLWDLLNLA